MFEGPKKEDWAKLEEALRGMPEKDRLFLSYEYHGYTDDDAGIRCGCLLGQITGLDETLYAKLGTSTDTVVVAEALGISTVTARLAETYNDRYYPSINHEQRCRRRYAYMLERISAFAAGTETAEYDAPLVSK